MVFLFASEAERDQFECIYHRYKRLMLHRARGILGDDMLAEDAVSEACIRIYRNLHKLGDTESPQTASFVVTVVKNAALTLLKRERRGTVEAIEETMADDMDLEGQVLSALSEGEMFQLVDALGDELRAPFVLRYAHGLSGREIATALGLSEGNVNVRLHRAKKKLAEQLRKGGFVHDGI